MDSGWWCVPIRIFPDGIFYVVARFDGRRTARADRRRQRRRVGARCGSPPARNCRNRFTINLNAINLRDPSLEPVRSLRPRSSTSPRVLHRTKKQITFGFNLLGHHESGPGCQRRKCGVPAAIERGNDGSPQWSPDGQRIVFDSSADGNWNLFVVRVAGGAPVRLTSDPSNGTWRRGPGTGDRHFASDRTGSNQVSRMPAGGGVITQSHQE